MKAGIVEPEGTAIASNDPISNFPRQQVYDLTVEIFLEAVFSMLPMPRLYIEATSRSLPDSCVKAGSNTSTVVLQVVRGGEKGTKFLEV
jgi:hypothetical protein